MIERKGFAIAAADYTGDGIFAEYVLRRWRQSDVALNYLLPKK
jgi:hypothetical protein